MKAMNRTLTIVDNCSSTRPNKIGEESDVTVGEQGSSARKDLAKRIGESIG